MQMYKFFFMLMIFLPACAHLEQKSAQNLDQGLARLIDNAEKRARASGTGAVVWKTKQQNIAATGVMVLAWPDSLRLEVQDPLGGMVALIILHKEDFWSYTQEQGIAWTGKMQNSKIRKVLPFPLKTGDYLRALLARPPLGKAVINYTEKPHTAFLTYRESKRRDYIEWDISMDQPTLWRIGSQAQNYIEVKYSDYRVHSGIHYPTHIQMLWIDNDREKFSLIWNWTDLATYIPEISNIFEIPPSGWAQEVKSRHLEP